LAEKRKSSRKARLVRGEELKKQVRNNYLKRTYGITLEEYQIILENQNFSCAICLEHIDNVLNTLYVDHCHTTGKIRGLLCSKCNVSLGLMKENTTNIIRMLNYLEINK